MDARRRRPSTARLPGSRALFAYPDALTRAFDLPGCALDQPACADASVCVKCPPFIAACAAITYSGRNHDLRDAQLSRDAGPHAGPVEALRHHHAEAVRQARHQAGRLLDHRGRGVEPQPDLSGRLRVDGRSREEVGGVLDGSGVDREARRDREERPAGDDVLEPVPQADELFERKIGHISLRVPSSPALCRPSTSCFAEPPRRKTWMAGTSPAMTSRKQTTEVAS